MEEILRKVSVLLGADDFEQFETYCQIRGHKKSTLIVRLIKNHLEQEGYVFQKKLFEAKTNRRR